MKRIKKAIYLLIMGAIIYLRKVLIYRTERKISKLEYMLVKVKSKHKKILKSTVNISKQTYLSKQTYYRENNM